jgi:purine-nucleoside phosphorylase
MAVLDLSADVWSAALGMPRAQRPDALVLEGTWWRERATRDRLAHLTDVGETAFPDIFTGTYKGARLAYCCAYGAARAVEPAHIFAHMGTPLIVQIGTCGALSRDLRAGMIMVPDQVAPRDGMSHLYGAKGDLFLDANWSRRARHVAGQMGYATRGGRHLTWPSLFAQSDAMCDGWMAEGFQSVDMELSAVAAVAQKFGAAAIALLSVWEALPDGKTFLEKLNDADAMALSRSNEAVFQVALQMSTEVMTRQETGRGAGIGRPVANLP